MSGDTRGCTGAQPSGPATQPQHLADLGSHLARMRGHVGPAVPEGEESKGGTGVVPVDVAPAGFCRMCYLAIEFHGDPELLVMVVQIAATPGDLARRLPHCPWQPMWSFDVPDIAELK